MRIVASILVCVVAMLAGASGAWATDTFPGTTLTGSSGSVVGTTVGMTGQTGEPASLGGGSVNSFWYSWTAPASGTFTAGTCNITGETVTNHDTVLDVYTGNAVNALTSVVQNDDTTGCNSTVNANYGSWVSFTASAGTTYRFRVDGYASATGGYTLRWGLRAVNVTVTDSSATESGDTASFTVQLQSPPQGSTAVAVTIGTSAQCTFAPTTFNFTSANWTTAQTVTVTAINDAAAEGTHSCSPASITTTNYGGVNGTPPTLTIFDNDNPSFTINKTASAGSIAAPGTITYTITVDNNGSAVLTGPTISDTLLLNGSGLALTSGPTLTSGDTNSNNILEDTETWIYTATYAVTQANIDTGGSFSNTATFDTNETAPQTSSAATTTITQNPNFSNVKTQSSGPSPVTAAGQVIGYSITIANTGNVSLTGLTISDTLDLGGSPRTLTSGPAYASGDTDSDGAIDVGETWVYAATYTVTQADIDATGSFVNRATFDTAQTAPITSNNVTTNVTRTPNFTVSKAQTAGPSPVTAAGQTITYTITVANTGNQSLTSPVISDTLTLGGNPRTVTTGPTLTGGDAAPTGILNVGETWTYAVTYLTTQADIDATGSYSNTATFSTAQVAAKTSTAVTTNVTRTPNFTVSKAQTAGPSPVTAAGQTITYTITVVNTGNQSLTSPAISDTLTLGGNPRTVTTGPTLTGGDAAPTGILNVGETWTYAVTYLTTQADIDATGSYSNTATFSTAQVAAKTSTAVTTNVTRTPSFSIAKGQTGGPSPVTAAGQTIAYTIIITNTGNQSLTGLTISDTFQLGGAARTLTTGPAYSSGDTDADGAIDVGEVWLYAATYLVPQADMDGTGSFTNVATYDTAQTPPSTSNTVTTNVTRTPSLSINKTFAFTTDANGNSLADRNDVVQYSYLVTNNGNVTITGVSVSDIHHGAGALGAISPASFASLAPGASTTFTASYTVVQGDLDAP